MGEKARKRKNENERCSIVAPNLRFLELGEVAWHCYLELGPGFCVCEENADFVYATPRVLDREDYKGTRIEAIQILVEGCNFSQTFVVVIPFSSECFDIKQTSYDSETAKTGILSSHKTPKSLVKAIKAEGLKARQDL